MNLRILLAFSLLNILTLCAVGTAGAEERLYIKQNDFPELPVPVYFPAKEQIMEMNVSDMEFLPDNQGLLLWIWGDLYRLDFQTESIERIMKFPVPGLTYKYPLMEWVNDNRHLIFYNFHDPSDKNGSILKWPTLEKVKENLLHFTISFDRHSILYQKIEKGPYYLWNMITDKEEEIFFISPLQFVDINPEKKTVTYIDGQAVDTGDASRYEIKPISLITQDYVSNEVIDSVTLEGASSSGGWSYTIGFRNDVFILDQLNMNEGRYLLGLNLGYHSREFMTNSYYPHLWNQSTGKLVSSIFGTFTNTIHYVLFSPPYGFSSDGKWLAMAVNKQEMKIIPVERRIKGLDDLDIGPFPKGIFSFSHDGTKVALFYPAEWYLTHDHKLVIIDLEPASPVNDFPLHMN